jgi:hypothetical protein
MVDLPQSLSKGQGQLRPFLKQMAVPGRTTKLMARDTGCLLLRTYTSLTLKNWHSSGVMIGSGDGYFLRLIVFLGQHFELQRTPPIIKTLMQQKLDLSQPGPRERQ